MSYMYRRFSFHFSAMMAAAVVGGLHAGSAWANPTGGSVVAGQGTINHAGSTTTINQQSPTLILNWQGFSISPSETVQFVQPSTTSIALNRVIGSEPSRIYGHLLANGQVFLINPNGVLFGRGASVNVGGLVASSLDLSDSDFLAGHYRFQGSSVPAGIVNQGDITASGGGSVALLGGQVINQGVIRAQLGTVALAAGSAMTLDFVGNHLLNVQVDQSAANALAANHQLIQADGGTVIMTAAARDALLDTVVNNDGVIEARTIQNQGGKIELLGSQDGGTVQVGGTLDASAPSGGDGGSIETSGQTVKVADGTKITTLAAAGKTGLWLVDPNDFTIAPSGADISGPTLSAALNNTDSTVDTLNGKTAGTGDIYVDDVVSWTANTKLTMNAYKDIVINSSMSATGSGAALVLNYNDTNLPNGGTYYLNYGSYVNLPSTASLSIGGHPYTIITSVGVDNDTSTTTLEGINNNLSGYYALGSNIDASATYGWTSWPGFEPIGTQGAGFTGQFAGLGHVITGLMTGYSQPWVGVFGYTELGSTVRDVGLTGGTISSPSVSNQYIGSLVGANYGAIINSYSSMPVTGGTTVGGLVGANYGTITESHASGAVTGTNNFVGGLVGDNEAGGSITNSYATGNVKGQGGQGDVGGLVGQDEGSIDQSYASGTVTGTSSVGGLVGWQDASAAQTTNSYATGSVTSSGGIAGGLIGKSLGTVSGSYATGSVTDTSTSSPPGVFAGAGGLIGDNDATVSASYASGSVTSDEPQDGGLVGLNEAGASIATSYYVTGTVNGGTLDDIGGLVGENAGSIDQSYAAAGTVTGANNVGGLVGWDYTSAAKITDSYATGTVSGNTANVGGLVGDNEGSISAAYAATSVSDSLGHGFIGGTDSGTTTGSYWVETGSTTDTSAAVLLTAAQSRQAASYVGWDFAPTTGAWRIYEGHTMPLLEHLLTPLTVTTAYIDSYYDGVPWNHTTLATPVYSIPGADSPGGHLYGLSSPYAGDVNAGAYTPDLWSDQQGYDISVTPDSLRIHPSDLEITVSDVTKTYDGTETVVGGSAVATGGTLLWQSDSLSGGTFTYTNANAGSGKTVTVSGVTVNDGNGGHNYTITKYVDNTTSTIIPAPLKITTSDVTKTYDGTRSAPGSLVLTDSTKLFGSDSLSGGVFTFDNANAGSGKTVTTSGVTVNDQNNGNNYTVTYVANTASTINPASLKITTSDVTKTYDGTRNAAGSLVLTGSTKLFGSDSLSGGVFTFDNANAGSGKTVTTSGVTVNDGNSGNNYTIQYVANTTGTINPASLKITTSDVTKTYDGTRNAAGGLVLTGSTKLFGSDSLSGGVFTFDDANAGSGKTVTTSGVTVNDGNGGNNYAVTYVDNTTSTITAAPLEITTADVTKTYDGTTGVVGGKAVAAGTTQLFGSDSLSGGVFAYANANAGSGKTVTTSGVTVNDGNSGNNYAVTYVDNTTSTITPAPLDITTANVTKTYDGTTGVVGGKAVATGGTQLFGSDTISGGVFAYTNANAGSGKTVTTRGVTVSDGNSGNNYAVTYVDNTTSTIAQAPLQITTANVTKTYDGTTGAAGTAEVTGGTRLFGSDSLSGGVFAFDNANAGSGKTVSTSGVTVNDGNSGGNYAVTYVDNTTSTINPAPLDITTANVTKTYDGTTSAAGSLVVTGGTQLFGSDTISGGVFAYTDKNAGTGDKTVTTTGVSVNDGNSGNNYAVTYLVNTTSTIDKAPLTLAAQSSTKTYDGTSASGGIVAATGNVAGDAVSASEAYTSGEVQGAGGSTLKVTQYAITDASGADMSGNYDVTTTTASGTIDPATITVSGITAQSKAYDGTTNATLDTNGVTLAGRISGDDVGVSAAGSFADPNAGIDKTVNLALSLTGPASGDYVLANSGSETTTTANIAPDALTITANDATRVSGQANPPLTLSYSGFVAGQAASSLTTLPTEWTTADTKSPVGTYPINVSGAVDPNYVFTYVPGVLTVTDGGTAAQVGSQSYVGAVASVGSSDAEGGLSSGGGVIASTNSKASTGSVCGPTADANCAKPDAQQDASNKALGKRFVSGLSLEIIADGMRLPAGVL